MQSRLEKDIPETNTGRRTRQQIKQRAVYPSTGNGDTSPRRYRSMIKIFRKIAIGVVAIAMLFGTLFVATGCNGIQTVFAWYEGDGAPIPQQLVMNAGETLTVSASHFQDLDFEFDRFELFVTNENGKSTFYGNMDNMIDNGFRNGYLDLVSIQNNIITAVDNGFVEIVAVLWEPRTSGRVQSLRGVLVAHIHVINEATMTPITTPEELAAMNDNLSGHFILMDYIDLGDWGEWTPIGHTTRYYEENQFFRGIFVNPHGYTISNLTITTSETAVGTGFLGSGDVGLFGKVGGGSGTGRPLICGIILEDLFIDVSDFEWIEFAGSPQVGGIAASASWYAIIQNVSVNGTIIGGGFATGGIAGVNSGIIVNCTFRGEIIGPMTALDPLAGVGGIVGLNATAANNDIRDNRVYADIIGNDANTGGIIGYNFHYGFLANSFFTGTITGRITGDLVGLDNWSHIRPQ